MEDDEVREALPGRVAAFCAADADACAAEDDEEPL